MEEPVTYIVNLSTTHTLYPISKSVNAFTALCDQFSRHGLFDCYPTLFRHYPNMGWVSGAYYLNKSSVIDPYKIGKMSTSDFINKLRSIFNFLDVAKIENEQELIIQASGYIKQITDDPIDILLIEAWNAIIGMEADKTQQFAFLNGRKEPIYLISNTNELNVLEILQQLRVQHPNISFNENIDLSVTKDQNPVEIAPNIFLCISYRFQLVKSADNNPNSTPSILKYLIKKVLANSHEDIKIISQFERDRECAKALGINETSIFDAENGYEEADSLIATSPK